MKYNREYAHVTGRDAVIHLCNNTQANFKGGFTLDDYPTYQA